MAIVDLLINTQTHNRNAKKNYSLFNPLEEATIFKITLSSVHHEDNGFGAKKRMGALEYRVRTASSNGVRCPLWVTVPHLVNYYYYGKSFGR